MVRKEGFIDLDKELKNKGVDITSMDTILKSPMVKSEYEFEESSILLKLEYDNEISYFKYSDNVIPYNELVANELARDFGFDVVEYDLAVLGNRKGVVSKNFRKRDTTYITGEEILLDFGYSSLNDDSHNLENIWDALEYRYRDHNNKREIVEKLMGRVVSLFIFDILLCQNDRHSANWEIEESESKIDIAPIYDNERMLSYTGASAFLLMLADDEDRNLRKNLEAFFRVSSENFSNIIKNKMWIISDENLESIFRVIEDKTGYPMPQDIKDYYLKEFRFHRIKLKKIIDNIDRLERDDINERKNK